MMEMQNVMNTGPRNYDVLFILFIHILQSTI